MPKVLIASATDLAPELQQTILWGPEIERVVASTPTATLEVARTFVPSLVVVDGTDPVAAQGLIRRLREHPGTRRSSVVVVARSASAADGDLQDAGANLVLRAPIEPTAWDKRLAQLLTVPRRLRIRFPVQFRREDVPGGDESVTGEAMDLSLTGMLLVAESPIPARTLLDLCFVLPGTTQESRAVGLTVRTSGEAPARVGIQFLRLEGDAKDRIQALLNSVPPDRSFGRYEPVGLLGEGSMGCVYRAFDPLARRVVAIKTPKPEHLKGPGSEQFLLRFRREAQAAGQLVHPNIVTIHDVGDDYFVMEHLEGATLQSLLRERGALEPEEVCRILAPVADALDYAHGEGIIHRDVKPANIMILTSGRPKMMDFGVAYVVSPVITASGGFFGSPAYMAPEQITKGEATAATDVYSLAAVAYEALTGHRPFEGERVAPVLYKVVNKEPDPPTRRRPTLPPAYDEVFRCGLAKDPAQRFASAVDLVAALRDAAALSAPPTETTISPAVSAATTAPPFAFAETLDLKETARRRLRHAAALAAAAVAALAGVTMGLYALREVAPIPPLAGLQITTQPTDAEIWLDGKPVGRSPRFLPNVPRGTHVVRVAAQDFVPAEMSVEAREEGPPVALRFQLQSLTGTLDIDSEPREATVRVDGRPASRTPASGLRLPPGARLIEIEQKGYRPWAQVVDVRPGETQHLVVSLQPAPGGQGRPDQRLRARGWVRVGDLVALTPGVMPPQHVVAGPAPYPKEAQRLGLKGTVTLELTVTETGGVTDARVVESAGEMLDRALLAAVRAWRYKPAEVNGVHVKVRIRESQTF